MTEQPKGNDKRIDRRSFVKYAGIITASASVSGCLGGGGDGGTDGGDGNGGDDGDGGGDGGTDGGTDGGDGKGGTSELTFQHEGFEDQDMSQWEVNHEEFKRTTVVAHSGKFSAGIKTGGVKEIATADINNGGARISRVEFYWWETGSSKGGGTRLLNSDGDVEIGVGTGNPDWKIDDQTGLSRRLGSASYEVWVQTVFEFDWENGFATVTLQDPENEDNSYTNEHPLKVGKNIQSIQLHGFDGSKWQSGIDMNWDDFRIEL